MPTYEDAAKAKELARIDQLAHEIARCQERLAAYRASVEGRVSYYESGASSKRSALRRSTLDLSSELSRYRQGGG